MHGFPDIKNPMRAKYNDKKFYHCTLLWNIRILGINRRS